ncbi:hypothetical protein [Shewanella sp. SACH]|nr:hypothetical protein [Shewanella sp. SACH]
MLLRKIEAHVQLFNSLPALGEKLTLGRREFEVRRVGRSNYQLVETFFKT